jgi:hypothetical protein
MQPRFHGLCVLLLFGVCSGSAFLAETGTVVSAEPTQDTKPVDFNTEVRPILSNRCFACHGPDDEHVESGLKLDSFESATAKADSGSPAIVAGDIAASELVRRIASLDDEVRMPPPHFGQRLTDKELDLIQRWIRQGANYSKHWSYETPKLPAIPTSASEWESRFPLWHESPIDRLLLVKLAEKQWEPSLPADRRTLLRRVCLDLTGLPPTLEQQQAFLDDESPLAYENLVDRLLASPAYGEQWGRRWLDLARYADSAGYADDPMRTIWGYRDWVIRAFNSNMPFDQFTIEQLAGDLLPDPSPDALVATGFHRNTLTNNEGGTNDEEFRNVAVVDRVNTTLAVWMGVTMACAQCHNHKYDPISQKEFFQVFAVLNQTEDADRGDESPVYQWFSQEQRRRRQELERDTQDLKEQNERSDEALLPEQSAWATRLREPIQWLPASPSKVASQSATAVRVTPENIIELDGNPKTDKLSLEIPFPSGLTAEQLTAIQITSLPVASLPGGGASHGDGNFVLTNVSARIHQADGSGARGKYVRIELPGKEKILSLAEVQVFESGRNIAMSGRASQSSEILEGAPSRAIDGNTSGVWTENSVTHSAISDSPWWELDLGDLHAVDSIAIWNRTDGGVVDRLSGAQVTLLDSDRQPVWKSTITKATAEQRWALQPEREWMSQAVAADFAQEGFPATSAIDADTKSGWAVGGDIAHSHGLMVAGQMQSNRGNASDLAFQPNVPVHLRLELSFESPHPHAVLSRFSVSLSGDPRASEILRLPNVVRALVQKEPLDSEDSKRLHGYYVSNITPTRAELRERRARLQSELDGLKPTTTVPILRELASDKRRETRIQLRGNYRVTGDAVEPGVPIVFRGGLPELQPGKSLTRLELAQWLVSQQNPLTARVLANRIWESLFGVGIVRSSEEFGSQGDLPTHPELLDYLAIDLMRNGWDLKRFLRGVVLTAAYRQRSAVDPQRFEADPENTILSRGPRFRVAAEQVRDMALASAGLLSHRFYGPPTRPPQPSMGLSAAFGSRTDWETSTGEDRFRRAIYTQWRRSNPYPAMATFDAPNREVCVLKRDRTNTPLQALVTLNDPVFMESAQGLSRQVVLYELPKASEREQVARLFEHSLSRLPNEREIDALLRLKNEAEVELQANREQAVKLSSDPIGPLPADADPVRMAAWATIGNVLLNLDEFLMTP